jgi:hypothetical protein
MAPKDPKAIAEKFVRRAQSATQDMITGVNNVTINPAQQAFAKEQKLLNNVTQAIQSGKWRRGMQTVTLESWKQSMVQKGAPRVAAGVQAAQPKMEAFYSELLPYQEQLQTKLGSMPDLTLEDSINRATTWMRGMANFKRRGQS